MYHVGDPVTPPTNRERSRGPLRSLPAASLKNRLPAIPETVRTHRENPQPIWQGLLTETPGAGCRFHRLLTETVAAIGAH